MAAYIYCRQSDVANDKRTDEDADTLSLEAQLTACRNHAHSQGWAIIGEYTEQFTGFSADRIQFLKMLRDIRNNHKCHKLGDPLRIEHVVIFKYLRLSRDPVTLTTTVAMLKSKGVEVEPACDQKLGAGKLDPLMLYMVSYLGKVQIEDSVEHAKLARKALADKGLLVCSGRARYGYKYDPKTRTRVIDEPAAKIIKKLFQWFAEGHSAYTVGDKLVAEGIQSPTGKSRWALKTLRNIIKDPSYKGSAMEIGKTQKLQDAGYYPSGGRKFTTTDKTTTVGESTPAIVSEELWDEANNQTRSRHKPKPALTHDWLVGRVYCTCGVRLVRLYHNTRKYWYWRCPKHQITRQCPNKLNHVNDTIIRNHAIEHLSKFLADPAIREAKLAQLKDVLVDPQWELEAEQNRKETDKLKSKMAKLLQKFGDDDELAEMLSEQIENLKGQIRRLEQSGRVLSANVAASKRATDGVDEVRGLLRSWPDGMLEGPDGPKEFEALPDEDKRLVVQTVGLRVDVARMPGIPQVQVQACVFDFEFLSAYLTERLPAETFQGMKYMVFGDPALRLPRPGE